MRPFTHFAALDWSGARGPRQRGIALAVASGSAAPALVRPGHIWSRAEILEWLEGVAAAGENMLIGFDFSAAFAFADHGAYFPGWAESPADTRALWALVERLAGGDPHYEAGGFLAHAEARRHFRHRGEAGDLFEAGAGRLRVVEHHQRATKQAASVSNFNLVGAALPFADNIIFLGVLDILAADHADHFFRSFLKVIVAVNKLCALSFVSYKDLIIVILIVFVVRIKS